jgi:hypothetical protein
MANRKRIRIGSFSKRRSYKKEALNKACEGLSKMMVKLKTLEAAQGIEGTISQGQALRKLVGGKKTWSEDEVLATCELVVERLEVLEQG